MFRLYDFECTKCGSKRDALIQKPMGEAPPKTAALECGECGKVKHDRLISIPAPYMGEKVLNPAVSGGSYDTMGYARLPDIPDLPGAQEYDSRVSEDLAKLPLGPNYEEERKGVIRKHLGNAPSTADYNEHLSKPEVKEIYKERDRIGAQNKEKRKRASAIRKGENINMRRDKCAGDPSITA